MIFSQSQGMYQAVLLGEKTLTTRLKLPAHIAKGKEWAIVPGRAKPAWWIATYTLNPFVVTDPRGYVTKVTTEPQTAVQAVQWLRIGWFVQACIHIETFYETPLQTMTEAEALQEGVASVEDYSKLWDRINNKKGIRWSDNPNVWRIKFSLPLDVCQAVLRVGRQAILDAAGVVLSAG